MRYFELQLWKKEFVENRDKPDFRFNINIPDGINCINTADDIAWENHCESMRLLEFKDDGKMEFVCSGSVL